MQFLDFRTGIHAEVVTQAATDLVIDVQSVSLPAGSVEGQHQQRGESLAQRELGDQTPQFGDQPTVASQVEVRLDALFQHRGPQLRQPVAFRVQHGTGDVPQCRAAEEAQRFVEFRPGLLCISLRERFPAPADQSLEGREVEPARPDPQNVPALGPPQNLRRRSRRPAGFQDPPQRRDVLLQLIDRIRRRGITPHRLDQRLALHRPVHVQQEHRQHCTLPRRPQAQLLLAAPGPDRPEDREP
nr:hypothetical protein [Streptomyces abyssalis]